MNDETRKAYRIGLDTDMVVFRDGRLDDSDYEVIVEELAKFNVVAEPARPEGTSPAEWIVVLEWIRDETEQALYTAFVLALGQRLWRHFQKKGVEPPRRVTMTEKGRTFSAPISEGSKGAGEVRRLIFYGPEVHFHRLTETFENNGTTVYLIPRISTDLIAKNGETHPFEIIASPSFDEHAENMLRSILGALRDELGEFRLYDMDGRLEL